MGLGNWLLILRIQSQPDNLLIEGKQIFKSSIGATCQSISVLNHPFPLIDIDWANLTAS